MVLSPLTIASPTTTAPTTTDPATTPTGEQILILLGYTDYQTHDTYIARRAAKVLTPLQLTRVSEIIAQLGTIDSAVASAIADSAVAGTCDTQMNWPAHIKMLREQAHALLEELGRLYDLPVGHSKYAKRAYGVSYQRQ